MEFLQPDSWDEALALKARHPDWVALKDCRRSCNSPALRA